MLTLQENKAQRKIESQEVSFPLSLAFPSGILGFEELPLVSVDYTNDTRSGIVDGPSTMVINETQVKILIWYDNEIGYVNRMMELVSKVAGSI